MIISILSSVSCKHPIAASSDLQQPNGACSNVKGPYSEVRPLSETLFQINRPLNIDRGLSEHHYMEEVVYPIKASKIEDVFLNFALLRKEGFSTWGNHVNLLKNQIKKRFAFISKKTVEQEKLEEWVDLDSAFVVYPDIYGGVSGGANYGSGRAASLGPASNKGIGLTGLSAIRKKSWQRTLTFQLASHTKSLGFFSLPHNEIIAQIHLGQRMVILVRKDPIRLGHYLDFQEIAKQRLANQQIIEKNKKRMLVSPCLLNQYLTSLTSDQENAKNGFSVFVENMGRNTAKQLLNGVFHTAPTASNIAFPGMFTDLESMVSLSNYVFAFHTTIGPLNRRIDSDNKFRNMYQKNAPKYFSGALNHES